MSDRIKISAIEIIELNARLREINSFDLEKIDFISERGNVLKIDKDKIDSWKFIGLNNTDFLLIVVLSIWFRQSRGLLITSRGFA
jgi:hypothetical protein